MRPWATIGGKMRLRATADGKIGSFGTTANDENCCFGLRLMARSAVWFPLGQKSWRSRGVWYLLVARSQIWYPGLGETGGLVAATAPSKFSDQAFLRRAGTKPPKMAEFGEPNCRSRQTRSRKVSRRYQTAAFCRTPPQEPCSQVLRPLHEPSSQAIPCTNVTRRLPPYPNATRRLPPPARTQLAGHPLRERDSRAAAYRGSSLFSKRWREARMRTTV